MKNKKKRYIGPKKYILKHYNYIGEEYIIHKHNGRYSRNENSRMIGMNGHYKNNRQEVVDLYNHMYNTRVSISHIS
jgi:hypothetical protein